MTFVEIGKCTHTNGNELKGDVRITLYAKENYPAYGIRFHPNFIEEHFDWDENTRIAFFIPEEAPHRLYFKITPNAKSAKYGRKLSKFKAKNARRPSYSTRVTVKDAPQLENFVGEYLAHFDANEQMFFVSTMAGKQEF